MPTVLWRFSSNASLSLVPTPSVPETSTGSLNFLEISTNRAEAADAGQDFGAHGALGQGFDALDQGIARIDIDSRHLYRKWMTRRSRQKKVRHFTAYANDATFRLIHPVPGGCRRSRRLYVRSLDPA